MAAVRGHMHRLIAGASGAASEKTGGGHDRRPATPRRRLPQRDGVVRALGNSMAVPCMRWIGERIAMVEELL